MLSIKRVVQLMQLILRYRYRLPTDGSYLHSKKSRPSRVLLKCGFTKDIVSVKLAVETHLSRKS